MSAAPIRASAPGKLVLSGEYAVLAGAPALVLAVDRRVVCELRVDNRSQWRFWSEGFEGQSTHDLKALCDGIDLPANDPARTCQALLRSFDAAGLPIAALPRGLDVRLDSSACYKAGRKLGLGSSAAICTALGEGLLALLETSADALPLLLEAHRAVQGGRGSGLDVATCWHGGLIRFETSNVPHQPTVTVQRLPAGIHLGFFWVGASATTSEHLRRFDRWRSNEPPAALNSLVNAGREVASALSDADEFMRQLRAYTERLTALDEAGGIGIYGAAHRTLADVADPIEVIYKPSGAGGGDVGLAVARSASAMAEFIRCVPAGIELLPLSMEQHGVKVST